MGDVERFPTEEDLEAIEGALGMGHGAWDHINPLEIIKACWDQAGKADSYCLMIHPKAAPPDPQPIACYRCGLVNDVVKHSFCQECGLLQPQPKLQRTTWA